MSKLYLVATPIGNLEDITLRARRILGEVDVICCEDTRKTGMLLLKLGIVSRQLISYYQEREEEKIPRIIQLIKLGKNVALVSNAGTPTISDPGYKLVRECLRNGIVVESIPGASAILTALVASGLPTDKFLFLGFLPQKQSKKEKLLGDCRQLPIKSTIVFFESPYRLIKTLNCIKNLFGDIEIVICREMTKIFEEIRREKISQSLTYFEKNKPRGEFVILLNPPQTNEN